ncbi:MAG: hypothetical protein C0518_03790 [Opitutus sp.]|nr:hypothetical protein [Opitutus sp.]
MGFFDRFSAKKPAATPRASEPAPVPVSEPSPEKPAAAGGVLPQLAAARAKLVAKDLPAAMAIYEGVLAAAGDRADILLTASADLGTNGYVRELVELIAPRYDAERHGPGPGLNLLQAYLAVRQPEAAQHLLDLLFSLNRAELEERLIGFSRAIAEMSVADAAAPDVAPEEGRISLVSISKPVWFYGLESHADRLLPRAEGRQRRLAFAQCALLGEQNLMERATKPEDVVGRFTRGLALWLADTFSASAGYEAIAGIGTFAPKHFALFPVEWTADNIRQLNESVEGGLDYVVTTALRNRNADYELVARIWEVKKFRELKTFTARWTPANADEALGQFHQQLRTYMEWKPRAEGDGLAYTAPATPLPYILALGGSLGLFLSEKEVIPADHAVNSAEIFLKAAQTNPADARAQLALVTAIPRLRTRGANVDDAALTHARTWLASDAAKSAGVGEIVL